MEICGRHSTWHIDVGPGGQIGKDNDMGPISANNTPSPPPKPGRDGTDTAPCFSKLFECSGPDPARPMAAPEVEAVLEFLRKNGFLKAEIALREDLVDKAQLGAFHLDKFVFPMVPPPPPVRISSRPEDAGDEGPTSGASSHDQFMSLGSSTSDVSSDFVNPYGLRSSSTPNSNASSDRMSQFGTARAYNDFDFEMQNDLYSYDEKSDDGNFMTPCFRGPEPSPGHAEDKFVMPSDKKVTDNLNRLSTKEEHEIEEPNGFTLERKDKSLLGERMDSTDNNWSLYDVCLKETDLNDLETENLGDICMPEEYVSLEKDPSRRNFDSCKIRYSGEDWFNGSKPNLVSEENPPTKDFTSTEELGASAKDQEGVSRDEILMVESLEEEENEVFELRIVHRKNRTGFEEYKDFPIVLNTIIVGRYYVTEYLGSAAFSKVVQALDLHTGTNVCLKIIKNDKDFLDQSLDEIKLLKLVNRHDPADEHHILRLYDYFYHQEHLFIVCELLRANLYEFQKFNQETGEESYFTLSRLQLTDHKPAVSGGTGVPAQQPGDYPLRSEAREYPHQELPKN
ncbi:hypothetical protein SAY86_018978 [Trapa natans]|uniref:Protein kinase domain-containing protein n=1 Tax=Trapa natans TaxID=22666 RepID=A0AAN7R1G7_TRANT|nr:hypothetical protein SAY86_018978 [Trapa natans]